MCIRPTARHLQDFLEENREIVTYEEIPASMQAALLAAEDRRFFSHWGIDIYRIPGSLLANLKDRTLIGQGASTLTQQLARKSFTEVGTQRSSASFAELVATFSAQDPRTDHRRFNRAPVHQARDNDYVPQHSLFRPRCLRD